jgi:hypothetical protein
VWREKRRHSDAWWDVRQKLNENKTKLVGWYREVRGLTEKLIVDKFEQLRVLQGEDGLLNLDDINELQ